MLQPIETISTDTAGALRGIFFDIDDTFTIHGKIPAAAFQSLWAIKESGLKAVPITGRPAGWCDHIARMWPVDGVVGENGAFYFWYDEKARRLRKRFLDPEKIRAAKRRRLLAVREEVLASVPGAGIASDQLYRETDLAIDYCEDVPPLDRDAVQNICRIFRKHGAECKVSSIHVNGWFGRYDKLQMTKMFVGERWSLDLDSVKSHFFFCGDSPNDEPMFAYFPYSAGVGNVRLFVDRMQHGPAFVAHKEGGEGFAEIIAAVQLKRSGQTAGRAR